MLSAPLIVLRKDVSTPQKYGSFFSLKEKITSRTRYKADYSYFKLISDPIEVITSQPNHGYTFDDCCFLRAEQILKMSQKYQKIYILWSGGIDSSVVISALSKVASKSEKEKIVIVMSENSIIESSEMFFKYILRQFHIMPIPYHLESLCENGILITGECADQLFGSELVLRICDHIGENAILNNYQDVLPEIMKDIEPNAYERFEPIVHESPFKIKTTFDYLWWWNITQIWQNTENYIFLNGNWKNLNVTKKNVLHFYSTIEFQIWSINNHHLKIESTWSSYKKIAKKFIESQTDCSFESKIKIGSSLDLFLMKEYMLGLDENLNYI